MSWQEFISKASLFHKVHANNYDYDKFDMNQSNHKTVISKVKNFETCYVKLEFKNIFCRKTVLVLCNFASSRHVMQHKPEERVHDPERLYFIYNK